MSVWVVENLGHAFVKICCAVCGRVAHFHPLQTFLKATMHYSANLETSKFYKFNCFSFRWNKMKTNMKGCVAKIKIGWVRKHNFDSVKGQGFKRSLHKNLSEYENINFLLHIHFQGSFKFQTLPQPHFFYQVIQGCLNYYFPWRS